MQNGGKKIVCFVNNIKRIDRSACGLLRESRVCTFTWSGPLPRARRRSIVRVVVLLLLSVCVQWRGLESSVNITISCHAPRYPQGCLTSNTRPVTNNKLTSMLSHEISCFYRLWPTKNGLANFQRKLWVITVSVLKNVRVGILKKLVLRSPDPICSNSNTHFGLIFTKSWYKPPIC